jgi:UDP-3-O-[3-hydroxymyristoyl] N-acetylglucosamine deacetylase
MKMQKTIAGTAICAGVGVHTGKHVRMVLSPASADAGIVFVRTDLEGDNRIEASAAHVGATMLGTTLQNGAGVSVATVEHLLAACAGLEVDNLVVELDGPELPILDGSAAPFVTLLQNVGLRALAAPRRVIRILRRVEIVDGERRAVLEPDLAADSLHLDVTIRFSDPAIGVQRKRARLTPDVFASEIAAARTFGFAADVERLHAAGRGLGASLANAIVVDAGRVVNAEGLRFEDEFVRHKMLDVIGDLALAGGPIAGRYIADQPGHSLNASLVHALMQKPGAWRWESLGTSTPALASVG